MWIDTSVLYSYKHNAFVCVWRLARKWPNSGVSSNLDTKEWMSSFLTSVFEWARWCRGRAAGRLHQVNYSASGRGVAGEKALQHALTCVRRRGDTGKTNVCAPLEYRACGCRVVTERKEIKGMSYESRFVRLIVLFEGQFVSRVPVTGQILSPLDINSPK